MSNIVESWKTTHDDTVEVYLSIDDQFRYRVQARNGEVVEISSEAYTRKATAKEAALRHHPVYVNGKRVGEEPEAEVVASEVLDSVRPVNVTVHTVPQVQVVNVEPDKLCFYDNFPCGKQR